METTILILVICAIIILLYGMVVALRIIDLIHKHDQHLEHDYMHLFYKNQEYVSDNNYSPSKSDDYLVCYCEKYYIWHYNRDTNTWSIPDFPSFGIDRTKLYWLDMPKRITGKEIHEE